jgi:hypothetical protein
MCLEVMRKRYNIFYNVNNNNTGIGIVQVKNVVTPNFENEIRQSI